MKNYKVPKSNIEVSSVVLGLMRIAKMDNAEIRDLYNTAREVGITVFDHADIYGGDRHRCEERFGEAVTLSASEREAVVIQSKVGIRRGWFDFSRDHILKTVDESLAALKTDYLDVLLLHRPDALVEPEEVAEAFDLLEAAGKVRQFGVSNHTPGQIELLKTAVKQPLRYNQVQLSITHANLIAQGVAANMDGSAQSISRDVGLIDYSRLNGMMLQAWSPFQKGFFDGVFVGDRESHPELNDELDRLAKVYGVTPTGIAVAWITRHPANIQVVLGTTRPQRVRECAAGSDVKLTREEWYTLFRAAGHIVP
ncbi:aldo/keto reductase [Devosia marina]|uniref:Aldo/keto reductase family oxidoreductase n=1 Tax=Devosia marina TaxID=2683198 RepID=A0A7X3K505_9HYPH|nr:aldo/keto reductase [Devosia marina]MVT00160.1 aldo/keto reductase family oxidoreductase [Devosia marina]